MERILDTLQTHLFIEMVHGCHFGGLIEEQMISREKFKLLSESFGVFDGCEKLAEKVATNVLEMARDGSTITYFNLNSNFIDFVIICLDSDGSKCAYDTTSKLNDKNKFDPLILRFGTDVIKSHSLKADIMHELTHAYEDWARRSTGSEELDDVAKKFGYGKTVKAILQGNDTPGSLQYAMKFMFYYFSDFELNAHIASMLGEFDNCGERFESVSEAINWIKKTNSYTNYLTLLDYIESFLNVTDRDRQEEILANSRIVSNRTFKTYDQFKKWLRKKERRIKNRLNTVIPKYVAEKLNVSSYIL